MFDCLSIRMISLQLVPDEVKDLQSIHRIGVPFPNRR